MTQLSTIQTPDITSLNFFNKVLITLLELSPDDYCCEIDRLLNQCKTVATGAERADYDLILTECRQLGLVQINERVVHISKLGFRFLSANRDKYFEITEAQKQLVADRIVFKGAMSHIAREVFSLFYLNQDFSRYELSTLEKVIPEELNSAVHLFRFLDIVESDTDCFFVKPGYSEFVYQLTADSKAISQEQLEKILMENKRLGAQGENAVVEFEKKRLLSLGKPMQAELVKRISTINSAAGYDIKSFDGDNDEIFYNRFIEVKATSGDEIRFYWTQNEKAVAAKEGSKYWIYVMVSFKETNPSDNLPVMIQNPEQIIPKHSYLAMEAHTYIIKEIDGIKLTENSISDVKWYTLD